MLVLLHFPVNIYNRNNIDKDIKRYSKKSVLILLDLEYIYITFSAAW